MKQWIKAFGINLGSIVIAVVIFGAVIPIGVAWLFGPVGLAVLLGICLTLWAWPNESDKDWS